MLTIVEVFHGLMEIAFFSMMAGLFLGVLTWVGLVVWDAVKKAGKGYQRPY